MKSCLKFLTLLFGLLSFTAYADINKWVDENNQIHYSDQPAPSNVKKVPINSSSESASDVPAQKTLAEREADFRKTQKAKKEAETEAAKQREDDQAKQQYCEEAKNNVRTLESSPRISTYDSKGELVYMDDAVRNQRLEEARKGINKHCK